jgi:serine/threonine-protein kinase
MIQGTDIDGRGDLYSLGAVAYFLLTGRPVFQGKNTIAVCAQHLNQPPTPPSQLVPDIQKDLEEEVLRCLAKEPEDRPSDAMALKESLEVCKDAGRWLRRDAETWWRQNAEVVAELQKVRARSLSGGDNSIAVDLGRRGTAGSR